MQYLTSLTILMKCLIWLKKELLMMNMSLDKTLKIMS